MKRFKMTQEEYEQVKAALESNKDRNADRRRYERLCIHQSR